MYKIAARPFSYASVPPKGVEPSILAAYVSKTYVYTIPPRRLGAFPGTRTLTLSQ